MLTNSLDQFIRIISIDNYYDQFFKIFVI